MSSPALISPPGHGPRAPSRRALELDLAQQRIVLDHAGVGIALVQQRRIVRCNAPFAHMYGHADAAAVEGLPSRRIYVDDESFHRLGADAYPVMARGLPYTTEMQQQRVDGSTFWARLTGTLIDPADTQRGSVWIVDDIDAHKSALAQQQLILDNTMVGVVFLRHRRVTLVNRAFEQLFGYGPGELDGSSSRQWYLSDEDWEEAGRRCYEPLAAGRAFEGEMVLRHRDGRAIWCEVRSRAVDPRNLDLGSIWVTMDITARKEAERALLETRINLEHLVAERTEELARAVAALEQKVREQQAAEANIQRLAHYDALTGLPNRVLLEDRCAQALVASRRSDCPAAVMFLDLDHFKTVNDSLGHRVGDAVLIELARRLQRVTREQDTVARLGGDEFILLLPETDADGAARVAAKVLEAAQVPFELEGRELTVTPSVGIAMYPGDGEDLDGLSRAADAAMYRAKEDGRNTFRFYTSALQAHSERALRLSNALRRALERDQFSLVFQPQQDLASGRITGAEALLRWEHPEFGAVSPAEFIPLAESNGLILPIGEWVLRQAARQIAQWDRLGLPPLVVAVNISSVQLRQADLPALVRNILYTEGVSVDRLEVELTEGAAMKDPMTAMTVMNALYEQGIELSLDDFGTGYSSLSYLKRFPIGKLKIDRSFVRDITVDPGDRAIVDAIIRMASSLGMRTVAEGVETEAQLAFLRERGCDAMQGYLLSRPLPAAEFERFVLSGTQAGAAMPAAGSEGAGARQPSID
jgi:diguanylate cyclase (GGDEF)-like protein/PAS domain S-box-containing protein